MIKVTSITPEMCECGRLYKDRISHLGKKMCSACYTGLSVEDLKLLWGHPVKKEENLGKDEIRKAQHKNDY